MPGQGIDWTAVIVALIAAIGSVTSAAIGAYVVYQLRVSSSARPGEVLEQTQAAAAATAKQTRILLEQLGNGEPAPDE